MTKRDKIVQLLIVNDTCNSKDWVRSFIQKRLRWAAENDLEVKRLEGETRGFLNQIIEIQNKYVQAGGDPKDVQIGGNWPDVVSKHCGVCCQPYEVSYETSMLYDSECPICQSCPRI